jgi:hypothetical protein
MGNITGLIIANIVIFFLLFIIDGAAGGPAKYFPRGGAWIKKVF